MKNGRVCVLGNIGLERKLFVSSFPRTDGEAVIERMLDDFGGTALFCTIALNILGCKTHLISQIGPDLEGEKVASFLQEANVDTTYIHPSDSSTTCFFSIYDRNFNRIVFAKEGRWNESRTLLMLTEALVDSETLVICPTTPSLSMKAAELSRRQNKTLVISPTGAFSEKPIEWMIRFFGMADFVFLNEKELSLYSGSNDLSQALKTLRFRDNQTIVVTCGRRGCIIISRGKRIHQPSRTVTKVEDPSGAGDALLSAFLWSLKQGCNMKRAAFYGCLAGSAFTKGRTIKEKKALLKKLRE